MTEALSTIDYVANLEKDAPKDVLKIATGMAYAEERKYVSINVPTTLGFEKLEIYHLTDVQWGSVCCQEKRFIEYRDFILAEPYRFTVFGGDMINASTMLRFAELPEVDPHAMSGRHSLALIDELMATATIVGRP